MSYEDYKKFKEMLGYLESTSTSGWAPIPDLEPQPVVVHAYGLGPEGMAKARAAQVGAGGGGGGGGSGGNAHHAVAATGTNGQGGASASPLMCACGKIATRLVGFNTQGCTPMCRECDMTRLARPNGLGRADTPASMSGCRLPAKPEPPPEPTHCACGASFATVKRVAAYVNSKYVDRCGDCVMSDGTTIDARIRDAREGRDEDPTTWTAGATPGWEWP